MKNCCFFCPRTQNFSKYDGLWTDHPFMIIKNEDHGFLYLGLFIPKPKAVQWPHETCIGFQILDNFSMHRGIQPKRWITGLHTFIGIFYFTLLPLGFWAMYRRKKKWIAVHYSKAQNMWKIISLFPSKI